AIAASEIRLRISLHNQQQNIELELGRELPGRSSPGAFSDMFESSRWNESKGANLVRHAVDADRLKSWNNLRYAEKMTSHRRDPSACDSHCPSTRSFHSDSLREGRQLWLPATTSCLCI